MDTDASYSIQQAYAIMLHTAFFNPESSISIQKHRPYTGNLNYKMLGDSKNVFLR